MNYLIMGNSNRIIKDEIAKIVKNNLKEVFNYNDLDLKDFIIDINTVDLFDTDKYFVVYETKFSKGDIELLQPILDNPTSNHIIFVSNEKISNKLNLEVIDLTNLNFKDFKPMVQTYLKKFGYKISDNDLFYIMETCLYNYDLILNEIDKLMLYYSNPCLFKSDDIKKIVSRNIVDNTNKLFLSILKKDYLQIDKIYRDLRLLKIDNYALTTILGKNFSDYLMVLEMSKRGNSKKDMESATGLKTYTIDNYLKYSNAFDIDTVKEIIVDLANIDYSLKIGDMKEDHALDKLLIEI
ncbi:MAG: hypothetical protein J5892_04290 [Bacilli bacterium]|nr:hypothetical protein [Bacilli bacterium]